MKTMEVLKPHRYRGKAYKAGDTYPIAKIHVDLHQKLGWGKVVVPEVEVPRGMTYLTAHMTAEAPKPKRKYVRKAKPE